jgi:NucS shadow ORF
MEGLLMSLDVPPTLLHQAEEGTVDEAAFVETVRASLPYAYDLIARLVDELDHSDAEVVDNQIPPPSEAERGQLLRALASDAIRGSLERHFGVRLAFQNCHRVAAFRLSAVGGERYRAFISPRGQLLNQSPELRDC